MAIDRTSRGALLALLAATLWGVSGAIAGGVFEVVSPARVTQSRALVALVVLVPYAAHRGVLRLEGGFWKFALLGLNLAVVNVTFYWALDALGVGPGATIQFLAPILVLGWMAVVHKTKVKALVWVAAVSAIVGVGLVTQAWNLEGSDMLGVVSGLVSAAAFATYLIYGEYLGKTYRPAQIAAWGFVFASAFWLVVLPIWTFPYGYRSSGMEGSSDHRRVRNRCPIHRGVRGSPPCLFRRGGRGCNCRACNSCISCGRASGSDARSHPVGGRMRGGHRHRHSSASRSNRCASDIVDRVTVGVGRW